MLFNIGRKLNGPLRLEDARFSAEDLFGLVGGYDTCMLTAGPDFLSYDDERLASAVGAWRAKAASRMTGTGLVGEDGEPTDELARALAPLSAPGMAVSNAALGGRATAGLFVSEEGWTILRKDGGFMGGWALVPADPSAGLSAACAAAFGIEDRGPSAFVGSGYLRDAERDSLTEAVNGGDREALSSIAWLRNIPTEALLDLSDAYGAGPRSMPRAYELWVTHTEGCEFRPEGGVRTPFPATGYRKTAQVTVIPSKGFYMGIASAPLPGDPFEFEFDDELCRARTFCRAGFVRDGDLFEVATSIPEWYPDDAIAVDG